ncbi:glycosyl hydrolase family 28-related protein [Coraliomargarita sp. W4R72]
MSCSTSFCQAEDISAAESESSWQSPLYGENWTPFPSTTFEHDKIIQDFSYAGYALGERSIPTHTDAPILNVLDFGADPMGEHDSTVAIQAALNQAASTTGPVVVYMPAGTYHVSPQQEKSPVLSIRSSEVVLRGDGPGKTFLLNESYTMRAQQIIYVAPASNMTSWAKEEGPVVRITKDLLMPTVAIPVDDVAPFKIGDYIILRADPNLAWIEDHKESGWIGYEEKLGSFRYLRQIEAINAEDRILTIDVPIRYTLKQAYNSRVYLKPGMLSEVGLEGFSIGNREHPGEAGWGNLDFASPDSAYTKRLAESWGLDEDFAADHKSASDVHFSFAISMYGVMNSWIRNVESFQSASNSRGTQLLSNGIRLRECRAVSVINCTMQKTQYGGGGGNGYMFRLDNSNECLLENCKAAYSRHGFSISGMASSGNVLYRCMDSETGHQTGGTGRTQGKGCDHHMWFSHSNLIDSCIASNSWFEARDRYYEKLSQPKHNSTSAHTVFWNTEGRSNQYHPFVVWSQQAKYGYVIGTRGAVNAVRTDGDYPEREAVSAPVDHVEGVGLGATLEPQSLYLDQLKRRLGRDL